MRGFFLIHPEEFRIIRLISEDQRPIFKSKVNATENLKHKALLMTILSKLAGLQAVEVLQILSGKDPLACTKCNRGKMMPIINGLDSPLNPG